MTTTQWDRFRQRARLSLVDYGGEDAIEITYGSASHTSGEGWDYSYDTSNPDATLDAETLSPSAANGIDNSGTFEDIDQLAFVQSSLPDRIYTSDTTIDSGTVESFNSITIESDVTVTVDGTLQYNTATINGTLKVNGTSKSYADLLGNIVGYGISQTPPTRVKIKENDRLYEVQSVTDTGDGYKRLELTDLENG